MKSHSEINDTEFEQLFKNASIEPGLFTHEAHLRLAWIHLRKYGFHKAIANITAQLKEYVFYLGATDKYNETVTIAAIKAVYHFMLKSGAETFQDFISSHPRLKADFKTLIRQHYTTNVFQSEEAKKRFMEPDLLTFDVGEI